MHNNYPSDQYMYTTCCWPVAKEMVLVSNPHILVLVIIIADKYNTLDYTYACSVKKAHIYMWLKAF